MKPSNTIVVSTKYIEEKEHQIADLSKKVERLQEQLDELQNDSNNLCNDIVDLNLTIENKKKQLNEANELIKIATPLFSFGSEKVDAELSNFKKYLIRWSVK